MLRSPYPWPGGKSPCLDIIADNIGGVTTLVDPFLGSGVVPLNYPHPVRRVIVNDKNGMLTNAWRSMQADPEAVAAHADWPISHIDLQARGNYLRDSLPDLHERVLGDWRYYDPELAGLWLWVVCNSIDMGRSVSMQDIRSLSGRVPKDCATGHGIQGEGRVSMRVPSSGTRQGVGTAQEHPDPNERQYIPPGGFPRGVQARGDASRPNLNKTGGVGNGIQSHGVDRSRPNIPWHIGEGIQRKSEYDPEHPGARLIPWLRAIQERIFRWIILSQDWRKVLDSRTVLGLLPSVPHQTVGIILDPPYDSGQGRSRMYAEDSFSVAGEVRRWLLTPHKMLGTEPWRHPKMKIVYCGFEGDFPETELPDARKILWQRKGGMEFTSGKQPDHDRQECLWFNPTCEPLPSPQGTLF